ncbi:ABC transporter permease [Pseudochelatococcus contaminans]|uniref:ABC-2 type transport system permease protein n=1 Tax=Pseudochelatococcus contaminans TaxID=1538103 RepID=A0A7W6EH99_9HYPH|nr:ABC transporter permease [Pseudochelatococcus contaminans]MBB3809943.1 ABC-2 type transport system permease protein [Pseudochelatococcus contaminans]
MWNRIVALVTKELQQLFSTRRNIMMLMTPLILQLAIFPFATTLEVRNATLAILNEDTGAEAIELVQRLAAASAFTQVTMIYDDATLENVIDAQTALLAIRIPPDFSGKVLTGEPVRLQALIDGRRSNAAQIAFAYAQQVVTQFAEERAGQKPPATLVVRNLYNPNLDYRWFVLPSLVAIIATVGCLLVTALSLAREREEGTFDQLLVTPLTPAYIMLGKAVPGILVGMAQGGIIALAAVFIYGVPFTGPPWLLVLATFAYALALSGVGLLISSVSSSQQQAFLGVFCFMVPSVVLSGYLAPIENMPTVLRWMSDINPLTHFIAMSKGIFLKSFGLEETWHSLVALFAIAAVTLVAAHAVFHKQTRS